MAGMSLRARCELLVVPRTAVVAVEQPSRSPLAVRSSCARRFWGATRR